jgi:hypothetical protein
LVCESITLRGFARAHKCSRLTVERKFEFVAQISRERHLRALLGGEIKDTCVSMDEMETYELTKLLPLSIALAVTEEGKIVETQVAEMKCKGKLAPISRKKYGDTRKDERPEALLKTVNMIRLFLNTGTIKTDGKPSYVPLLKNHLPGVTHERYSRKVKALWGTHATNKDAPYGWHARGRPFDPIFLLNQRCAKIRSQMSRMRRRFWGTTKKKRRLEMHLWIFTAWQNGYEMSLNFC